MIFDIVEKKDHSRIHASFPTKRDAEHFLAVVIPKYGHKLRYLGKKLGADDFEVIESVL